MSDDAELLRSYSERADELAFAEFVRRNIGLVYASAQRRLGGDAHGAGEVAQRVFIAAAKHAPALARHANITAWLFAATRNSAVNLMRDEQRRAQREREAAAQALALAAEESEKQWAEMLPVLDDAIDGLGERDREAVLLRYCAGLPLAEIGRRLGVNENTARMRVQRALEKLNVRLARRMTSSAALGATRSQHLSAAVPAGLAGKVTSAALTALHSSTTASTASAAIVMSTGKWCAVAAGIALVAMVGTWSYSSREKAAALIAQQQQTAALADLEKLRTRAAEAEGLADALKAQLDAIEPDARPPVATPRPADAGLGWDPVAEGTAFMARNPEVKRALEDYVAASVRFRFGELFRERAWSAEKTAEFVRLVGRGTGMGARAEEGGSMTLSYGADAPRPDFTGRINALLDSDDMKRWDELGQRLAGRYLARDVASALYFTDTPLSTAQARELVEIVTATRPPKTVSGVVALNWPEVMAKASELLAPAQLEALAGLRAKGEFIRVLNRPRGEPGASKGKPQQ